MSCEECERSEENNLGWYVNNSLEELLQGVRATDVIKSDGTVSQNELKRTLNNEKLNSWKDKRLCRQLVREMPETTLAQETWKWLRMLDLKVQTVPLICAAQEQTLRTKGALVTGYDSLPWEVYLRISDRYKINQWTEQ